MKSDAKTTEVSNDGLRYKKKAGGSPFAAHSWAQATMSCFKCGQHTPQSRGSHKKLLGRSVFVCHACQEKTSARPGSGG